MDDYSRVILEMLSRIKKLEEEVDRLKAGSRADSDANELFAHGDINTVGKRDTTRYMFNGAVYAKNRLVLAVVKAYVAENCSIKRNQMKEVFERSLQGSIGVVENKEIAQERFDYNVRFFAKPEETIHLVDGDMFVCSQWGIMNISNFLKRATMLGFQIEIIR